MSSAGRPPIARRRILMLGPFELRAPIGQGSTGRVWAGRHRADDTPIAVKVLTGEAARDPRFHAAFRNELRAAAGLDHPSIIAVFDHGIVDAAAADASGGRLREGSPYIVMERADGGSLRTACGELEWPQLREILLTLLDALAHAHARGVVHRDIKPGNVLRGRGRGLKLSDFGIANAMAYGEPSGHDDPSMLGSIVGTPAYMPPEQVRGRIRDQGPWSDLYALGCLAFRLASGEPPLRGKNSRDTMRLHLEVPPPRLVATRPPVPDGFEAWLHRLLAKDPRRRYRRAADAAWALARLPAPSGIRSGSRCVDETHGGRDPALLPLADEPTAALTAAWTRELTRLESIDLSTESEMSIGGLAGLADRPPMPVDWRATDALPPPRPPAGVGLGLWGLRAIPFVGRRAERDHLWSALREVVMRGRAGAIILEGPTGIGRSRLASWLCERAHELGAAEIWRAVHGPEPGPADGVGPMLGRFLRIGDLPLERATARIARTLRDLGVDGPSEALAALGCNDDDRDPRPGFVPPVERYATLRRFAGRIALERPLIICLEDVQWGADALAFARHVLETQDLAPRPILFALTVRSEALVGRPAEAQAIAALGARSEVDHVELGPLAPDDARALAVGLLGLDGDLADRLQARTAGNALFAVQLVGDWVERGLLVPSSRGFRLVSGAGVELPDDVHAMWVDRVEHVLARAGDPAVHGIELAAALGQNIDTREWRAAAATAGLWASTTLVERLIAGRLVTADTSIETGWSFVHAMVRESLERRAREGGRSAAHHEACAGAIGERGGPDRAERVGWHRYCAGQFEASLEPLLAGARNRHERSDFSRALRLLELRESALRAIDLSATDSRWGHGWVERAIVHRRKGEDEQAEQWAKLAAGHAEEAGWTDVLPHALNARALVALQRGDLDHARTLYAAALAQFEASGDEDGAAECLLGMAFEAQRRGDRARIAEFGERARARFAAVGNLGRESTALRVVATGAVQRGEPDVAAAIYERAFALAERAGNRLAAAACVIGLGDTALERGNEPEAEGHYRRAVERLEAIGSGQLTHARLNLGLVLVRTGRDEEARPLLDEAVATFERARHRVELACARVLRLPGAAARGDWAAWDADFTAAGAELDAIEFLEAELGRVFELAAQRARAAGVRGRAEAADRRALGQWTGLGRDVDATRVRARLGLGG